MGHVLMQCGDVMGQEHYGSETTWQQRGNIQHQIDVFLHVDHEANMVNCLSFCFVFMHNAC